MSTQTLQKWNKVKLGDVAEIESGGTPSSTKPEYWDGGDICWATLPDLENKYLFDTQRKITQLGLKNSSAKLLPINSVIFSSRATIGEVAITKVETSTNQGSKNFICDPAKIDYEFLYYLLKSKIEEINNLASGATYKEINKTVFSGVEIEIPNIPVQKQIAEILAVYDNLIYNNTRRIQILEQTKQAIYTEWFVNFRFPGHEKIRMIDSRTGFGRIPEGWRLKKLKDVIELVYGKALKEEDRVPGNVLVYGSSGIVGTHNKELVEAPGIVVGRKGNAGSVHWVEGNFYPIDTTFYVKTSLNLFFVYYLLKQQIFVTGDVAVPGLNRDHAYFNDILLPEENLIELFSINVRPLFDLVGVYNRNNEILKKTRDILIPKLVTGKIKI